MEAQRRGKGQGCRYNEWADEMGVKENKGEVMGEDKGMGDVKGNGYGEDKDKWYGRD